MGGGLVVDAATGDRLAPFFFRISGHGGDRATAERSNILDRVCENFGYETVSREPQPGTMLVPADLSG